MRRGDASKLLRKYRMNDETEPPSQPSDVAMWHKLSGIPDNVTDDGEIVDIDAGLRTRSDKALLRAAIATLSDPDVPSEVRGMARCGRELPARGRRGNRSAIRERGARASGTPARQAGDESSRGFVALRGRCGNREDGCIIFSAHENPEQTEPHVRAETTGELNMITQPGFGLSQIGQIAINVRDVARARRLSMPTSWA